MAETLTFDPELAYPSYDKPFLESWDGRFERVFVLLHPFLRVKGIDPYAEGYVVSADAAGPSARAAFLEAEETAAALLPGPLGAVAKDVQFVASLTYPDDPWWDLDAQHVSWREVAERSGLLSVEQVGVALLAMIRAIRGSFPQEVSRLVSFCEATKTFPPSEGQFQIALWSSLTDFIRASGSPTLCFQGEFDGDPTGSWPWEKLEPGLVHRGSLFSADKSALVVVDWDSYFTLIAGPTQLVEPWVETHSPDGFFADETTTHHWWADPAQLN